MDKIKKIGRSSKKFVADHKVGIAVAATTLVCYKLHRTVVHGWNDFLKEHDLYDTYYTPED